MSSFYLDRPAAVLPWSALSSPGAPPVGMMIDEAVVLLESMRQTGNRRLAWLQGKSDG